MITLDKVASPEYREQLQQMYDTESWSGGAARYAFEVYWLMRLTHSQTVLDYGCGPGSLANSLKAVRVMCREFDPGIPGKAQMPSQADLVACIDVMEHVEPDRLDMVLRHIYDLTGRAAFFLISTRSAEKRLPDGRNAHLIIDNGRWWYEKLLTLNWKVDARPHPDPDNVKLWCRKDI